MIRILILLSLDRDLPQAPVGRIRGPWLLRHAACQSGNSSHFRIAAVNETPYLLAT